MGGAAGSPTRPGSWGCYLWPTSTIGKRAMWPQTGARRIVWQTAEKLPYCCTGAVLSFFNRRKSSWGTRIRTLTK